MSDPLCYKFFYNDFIQGWTLDKLKDEIAAAGIKKGINQITDKITFIEIKFDEVLSNSEIGALKSTIANHDSRAADSLSNNFAATTNPTASDDTDAGYSVGSQWINTADNKAFICTRSTAGGAVWVEISVVASGAKETEFIQKNIPDVLSTSSTEYGDVEDLVFSTGGEKSKRYLLVFSGTIQLNASSGRGIKMGFKIDGVDQANSEQEEVWKGTGDEDGNRIVTISYLTGSVAVGKSISTRWKVLSSSTASMASGMFMAFGIEP